MSALTDLIKLYQGPKGTSSYFFIEDGKRRRRNARVTLALVGIIQEKLAVTGSTDCVAILLPEPFKDQLTAAGICVDQAWSFIEATLSANPVAASPRMKSLAKNERRNAERLARILATVDGKQKSAEALGQDLWTLMANHLEEAIRILNEWRDVYGFGKGGHIIVGNRSNRLAKSGTAKGSGKAA